MTPWFDSGRCGAYDTRNRGEIELFRGFLGCDE